MNTEKDPSFQSVPVPFVTIGNRRGLTAEQIAQDPYLADFVRRFPDSFEQGPMAMDVLLFKEPTE